MKLVLCIIHNRDKGKITEELIRAGYKFTVIASTGGFLREGNTTFLIGVEESDVQGVITLIGQNCQAREQMVNVTSFEAAPASAFIPSPVKVPVGGAVVFVMPVDRFERF